MAEHFSGLAESGKLTLTSLFIQSYNDVSNEPPYDCVAEVGSSRLVVVGVHCFGGKFLR